MKSLLTLSGLITVCIILDAVTAEGTEPPKTEVNSRQQEEPDSFITMIENNLDEPLSAVSASVVKKFNDLQNGLKSLFSKMKKSSSPKVKPVEPKEQYETLPVAEADKEFKQISGESMAPREGDPDSKPIYHRYKRPLVSYAVRVPIMTKY